MVLMYQSTRNKHDQVTASQAILKGIADDGGLYIPTSIPSIPVSLDTFLNLNYAQTAYEIMRLFFDDFTQEELTACIDAAYQQHKFDAKDIVPVTSFAHHHFLELFHGPTIAFKDMALSILPYLLTTASRKNQNHHDIVILTATSGDTGKAAMAGFADVPNTHIMVFYPNGGVSDIQEAQMLTQKGDNTSAYATTGNFDQAQTEVKKLFTDTQLTSILSERGFQFSSANSINIGRLIPQIAYYVYGYAQLVKQGTLSVGDSMNVAVPTGNFGNILAAYYAKQMGLPIHKLICASNQNNVLTDFFNTGTYNRQRDFFVTNSPSMDIVISSNLERLLCHISGNDTHTTAHLMAQLSTKGEYTITSTMHDKLADFYAGFATEQEIDTQIRKIFNKHHYLMDPHTAVAHIVYEQYLDETHDTTPTLIASTASPYKFPRTVLSAIDSIERTERDIDLADRLTQISHIPQPPAVLEVKQRQTKARHIIETAHIRQLILERFNSKR